jgi:hypothetical protein
MEVREIELIEHLDFDPDFACESRWSNGEEAEWLVTMLCCGRNKMLCHAHKIKTERYNAASDTQCLNCNAELKAGTGMMFTRLDTGR